MSSSLISHKHLPDKLDRNSYKKEDYEALIQPCVKYGNMIKHITYKFRTAKNDSKQNLKAEINKLMFKTDMMYS